MKSAVLLGLTVLLTGWQGTQRVSATGRKIPQGAHVSTFYVN